MQITTGAVRTLEERFVKLYNTDYELALKNAWWDKLATLKTSEGSSNIYQFLLSSFDLAPLDDGTMIYSNMLTQAFSATNADRGGGLKIKKNQLKDDEFGFAADWMGQAGAAMALAPQYLLTPTVVNGAATTNGLIIGGATQNGYDGVPFFSASHPVNPFNAAMGTYANIYAGASYALSITSYAVGEAKLRSLVMPNGRNRNLKAKYLVAPPSLRKMALEVTGAKFVSSTAQGGPTENVFIGDGVEPLIINELEVEPDSWYLVADTGSGIGPFIYQLREAFEMNAYTGMTQAELNRVNEFEWQIRGRDVALYGHPYSMIKFTGH
jgi:phage major head subunit gpT-like protein